MRPVQTRARRKVERILDAAQGVLAEQGVDAVTTSSVARAAGVPVGSVYTYFRDRDSILLTLGVRMVDLEDAETIAAIRAAPAEGDLRASVARVFDVARAASDAQPGRRALGEELERLPEWREIAAASAARIAAEIAVHPSFAAIGADALDRKRAARIVVAISALAIDLARAETSEPESGALLLEGQRAVVAYAQSRRG